LAQNSSVPPAHGFPPTLLVTDCYLVGRLQTSSLPRFNRKYPCNSLLLGLGDSATERVEMALAEEDEADELDRWALRFPGGRYCDRGG
jgi:hypothetical protein